MNYQTNLIKRKEYFGVVWLAAHHPAKLSKVEIIRMDLSAKCKEIIEHAINGKSQKPRFSLLVLSHLMYGLVVILNKKNTYLYNELVALKEMLSITFYHEVKEKKKAVKKVKAADKKAITIKETIPEAFSQYSLDTLELDRELEKTVRSEISIQELYKKITLEEYEQEDMIARTTIIPVEYDYSMDSFGEAQGVSLMFDLEQGALLETTGKPPSPEKRLSRIQKITERTPFREITNEAISVVREAHPSRVGPIEETTIMHETEVTKQAEAETAYSRLLDEFQMPALFQETVRESIMQHETLVPPVIEQPPVAEVTERELRPEIEEVQFTEEHALRPLPKSISVELRELREEKSRRQAARAIARERAVTRRHQLIIDHETEISSSELKSRMAPRTEDERELDLQQKRMFREKNTWLLTKNDYFLNEHQLLTASFSKDTKRTDFPMSDFNFFKQHSMRNQLVMQSNLLTSSQVRDDTHFYLTEARERARELQARARGELPSAAEILPPPPPFPVEHEFGEKEIQRAEFTRELSQERTVISKGSSAKRRASMRESLITTEPRPGEPAQLAEHTLTMDQQAEISIPQMGPLDSFVDQTIMPPPPIPPVEETAVESEVDDYEKLILDKLGEAADHSMVLQEFIQNSILPRKCSLAQKPRRFFAAKSFFIALKLAGQTKIQLEQETHYASIHMFLI